MRTNPWGVQTRQWAAWGVLHLLLLAGCAGQRAEVRGQPPSGPVITVSRLAAAPAKERVTVRGTMAEK